MNYDDLDKKIIGIRKRGLNKILEDTLTADIRKEFYENAIKEKINNISDLFKRNVLFLQRMHHSNCAASKIRTTMGLEMDRNYHDTVFGERPLYSLRVAIIVAEFYGIPTELLLFVDLEANEQTIKKQYPAIFKQSRN
jgi:hypothetical protein